MALRLKSKKDEKIEQEQGAVATQQVEQMPEVEQKPQTPVKPPFRKYSTRVMRRIVNDASRQNLINVALVMLVTIVVVIFILSLMQERMGSFIINLDRMDMYTEGISISETPQFSVATSRLESEPLGKATNISVNDLPEDLYQKDGKNNGDNYISYSFYVRNEGKKTFDYRYRLKINTSTKGVDGAVRVAIYSNSDIPQIFAKMGADGQPEPGTEPFVADKMVNSVVVKQFEVGKMDKYTVVIWLEGSDPQCTDDLFGGAIGMSMDIDVISNDK